MESDKNVFAFINRKKEYWAKHGKHCTPEENDETPAKSKKRKKQEKREGKNVKETKTEEDQKLLEIRQRNKPNDNSKISIHNFFFFQKKQANTFVT